MREAPGEKAQLARFKWEHASVVRQMKILIVLSDSDHNGSDTSDDDDQDPPPASDRYSCAVDLKGKGPARKW